MLGLKSGRPTEYLEQTPLCEDEYEYSTDWQIVYSRGNVNDTVEPENFWWGPSSNDIKVCTVEPSDYGSTVEPINTYIV